jgi:uncharacterized OsmC-like protein
MPSNSLNTALALYACESYDLDMAARTAGLRREEMKSELSRMGVKVRESDTSSVENRRKLTF